MPNRDGTGPEGKGPKTGRRIGNCEGAEHITNVDGTPLHGRGLERELRRGLEDDRGRRARRN